MRGKKKTNHIERFTKYPCFEFVVMGSSSEVLGKQCRRVLCLQVKESSLSTGEEKDQIS